MNLRKLTEMINHKCCFAGDSRREHTLVAYGCVIFISLVDNCFECQAHILQIDWKWSLMCFWQHWKNIVSLLKKIYAAARTGFLSECHSLEICCPWSRECACLQYSDHERLTFFCLLFSNLLPNFPQFPQNS